MEAIKQRRVFVSFVAIALAAAAVAALTSRAEDWQPLELILVLLAFNVVSELQAVPRTHAAAPDWRIALAMPLVLAQVLLGPAPAMAIAAAGLALPAIRERTPPLDVAFNAANYGLFLLTGGLLARWAIGAFDLQPDELGFAALTVGVYAVTELMSFAGNMLDDRLVYRQTTPEEWRREAERQIGTQAPPAMLAAVAVLAYGAVGIAALGFLAVVQLLHQRLATDLTLSLDRAEALEAQARELSEISESRGRLVGQVLRAEENERRRLAEALHDQALQDLLAIRQGVDRDGDGAGRVIDAADRAIRQLRTEIFDLHPAVLEAAGLRAAVSEVAGNQAERGGFSARVEVDEAACGSHDALLFALAREQLANVAKHAGASQVSLVIGRENGSIELEVVDDGCGMDPRSRTAAVAAGHIGLASSAERVEALGGTFEIDSAPGGGTRIRTTLPAG